MSSHHARLEWTRNGAPFTYAEYPRNHAWRFEGGSTVAASAAPAFKGDPALVDPEEAFVASIASCHMLTFLALACKAKFTVESYVDDAVGTLAKDDRGRQAITKVVLSPQIEFGADGAPDAETLADLHHRAHEMCFIANSVTTEIVVEPAPHGAGV
jgi:organic hydroperoxide reductase OsmC/OhrA